MSDIADIIADLVRAGVDAELIGRVAAAYSARDVVIMKDEAAERRRERDRDRKRTVRGNPQTSADSADPSPRKESPPEPPTETQTLTDPTPPIVPRSLGPADLRRAEDAIWADTPKLGRERSSRKDMARALGAAVRRGHDPARVRLGLRAAYASASYSGDHAKGVHRLIEADRWESFLEPDPVKRIDAADWSPERWRAAAEIYRERGLWKPELGPEPGEPGCRAPLGVGADLIPFPSDRRVSG